MGKTKARPQETNFTVKGVERLSTKEKRFNVFDSETRGLGVAVYPSGQKTFFHLQKVQGWPRRTTLGVFPDMSIEAARGKASELNGKLSKWRDNDYQGQDPIDGQQRFLRSAKFSRITSSITSRPQRKTRLRGEVREVAVRSVPHVPAQSSPRCSSPRARSRFACRNSTEIWGIHCEQDITFLRALFNHAIDPDVAPGTVRIRARNPRSFYSMKRVANALSSVQKRRSFSKSSRANPTETCVISFLLRCLRLQSRDGALMRWDQLDWQRGLWIIPNPKGKKDRKAQSSR